MQAILDELGFYDETYITDEIKEKLEPIKGMPFWIEDIAIHKATYNAIGSKCCFNHYIGLPVKNQRKHAMYDYEIIMFKKLFVENKRRLYVKKSRGLGVTEFMLRLMAWLSLTSDILRGMQMGVITGPRQKTAEDIIVRMKNLFMPRLGITLPFNRTTLVLNACRINAYPSKNIEGLRGQDNMVFILADEADFFRRSDQINVRDCIEGYIGKNDSIICLVSTPNEPNGLFENIEKEPTESEILEKGLKNVRACLYERLFYDFQWGEKKIYTKADLDEARKSPSWLREYCLQYGYGVGTIFSPTAMETVKLLGEQYRTADYFKVDPYTPKAFGVDPGYGQQSGSALVCAELMHNGIIRVLYAKKKMSLDYGEITDWVLDMRKMFDPNKIYVDGWHSGFIRTLKKKVGERSRPADVDELIARAKKHKQPIEKYMHIIPVPVTKPREILTNTKDTIETEESLAVDAIEFNDLYIDLVSAKQTDGKLEKEGDDQKDLMDALMYSLLYFVSTNSPAPPL